MKYRWTMKDLREFSDLEILRALVVERASALNPNAPFLKRLIEIRDDLTETINKQKK